VVAYAETKYAVAGVARVTAPGPSSFLGVVVLDGRVSGRWKRTLTKQGVTMEAELHRAFNREQTRALQRAANRYGNFLGCDEIAINVRVVTVKNSR
jgi:hypothetical protein